MGLVTLDNIQGLQCKYIFLCCLKVRSSLLYTLFQEIALPLLYASIRISKIEKLEAFYQRLHVAEQKWDSIRRIPYSSPGRWVQALDVRDLAFEGQAQALMLDSLLTQIFPLVPFLSSLSVNPSFVLSRRVLSALSQREGSVNLRSLTGLSYVPPPSMLPDEDPFVNLLRCCPNLEVLGIIGQGLDPTELQLDAADVELPSLATFRPLSLPNLRILSLLSMHSSPLMLALLRSPLPGITKLTVTPYNDIPYPASLVSELIATHGPALSSLMLLTLKSWPTRLRPSPPGLLDLAPHLNHLSLESPLPSLSLNQKHGLKILSIPRPTPNFWMTLERLLPLLPDLTFIRARDVHWLKKGISSVAQEAGIQGEMRLWKRRLERRGIRLLDANWHEHE